MPPPPSNNNINNARLASPRCPMPWADALALAPRARSEYLAAQLAPAFPEGVPGPLPDDFVWTRERASTLIGNRRNPRRRACHPPRTTTNGCGMGDARVGFP